MLSPCKTPSLFKCIKLKHFIIPVKHKDYCPQSQMTIKSCRHLSHHEGITTTTIKLVAIYGKERATSTTECNNITSEKNCQNMSSQPNSKRRYVLNLLDFSLQSCKPVTLIQFHTCQYIILTITILIICQSFTVSFFR